MIDDFAGLFASKSSRTDHGRWACTMSSAKNDGAFPLGRHPRTLTTTKNPYNKCPTPAKITGEGDSIKQQLRGQSVPHTPDVEDLVVVRGGSRPGAEIVLGMTNSHANFEKCVNPSVKVQRGGHLPQPPWGFTLRVGRYAPIVQWLFSGEVSSKVSFTRQDSREAVRPSCKRRPKLKDAIKRTAPKDKL